MNTRSDPDSVVLTARSGHVLLVGGTPVPHDAGSVLLPIARSAIAKELGMEASARHDVPWLQQRGASFITLTHAGKLRGCIGTLKPHRSLAEDVRGNAIAAAFRDPRFKPLSPEEFGAVSLEVSLLSALEAIAFVDEPDALRQLRPGTDGIVLEYGHHSSTFLPQVWESIPEPTDFLAQLKYKAGLPPDFWDRDVRLSRYTATKWRETE